LFRDTLLTEFLQQLQGIYPGAVQTKIQLLTVPVFVPAAFLVLVTAWFSDKLKQRGPFIMCLLPISMVGYILLIASSNPRINYAGVFVLAIGIYPSAPAIIVSTIVVFPPESFADRTRAYRLSSTTTLRLTSRERAPLRCR
jgi:MFS family permease